MCEVLNMWVHGQHVAGAVRVDRKTKWGNPFVLDAEHDRDWVCDMYEEYIKDNATLMAALPELRGKDLLCWCAPKRCHADTLLRLANA